MKKMIMVPTCSSAIGCFDGHGSLRMGYKAHRPMHHVQGYSGSHWMPASGNYLLCITPAAKQTRINKYTYKAGCFDGNGNALALVHNCVHRPMEEVQSFTRSPWAPPLGKYYAQ
jgi:hypothetical protein